MFFVRAKPEYADTYNSCCGNENSDIFVYDIKIDGLGNICFLIYNKFWHKWKLEPANHFEPIE